MKRLLLFVLLLAAAGLLVTYQLQIWPFGPKHVRLLNSDGDPLLGAVLNLQRPGEEEPDFQSSTSSGDGWMRIPREKIRDGATMRAVAQGCGILTGELPRGSEIRLPAAKLVTLTVPGDFPLPRPPWFLVLELEPAGEERSWAFALKDAVAPANFWSLPEVDRTPGSISLRVHAARRSIRLLVPRRGKWLVHWSLMVYRGNTGSGSGPDTPIEIDIPDDAVEVELPLTEAQLRKHWRDR